MTPDAASRAERLLRDVLGEQQFRLLQTQGYLDLPSQRYRGRSYRLDTLGNLSVRDVGETGFDTTLCVQPAESIPRDDQVAMRYLLITADEDRLLQVANPICFGLVSLARALRHDFAQRYPDWLAATLSFGVIAFFLTALAGIVWLIVQVDALPPGLGLLLAAILIVPALVGLLLAVAGVSELRRAVRRLLARRRA